MSTLTAPERYSKAVSEVRNVAVDFTDVLDAGEVLTGTPSLSVDNAGLTTANAAVSTTQLEIGRNTVTIGKAVQFTVSSGTAETIYTITIDVDTNATNAQTIYRRVVLEVIADWMKYCVNCQQNVQPRAQTHWGMGFVILLVCGLIGLVVPVILPIMFVIGVICFLLSGAARYRCPICYGTGMRRTHAH